jgi:NADH-ubiquinone oxidoreductase chain 6
MELLFNIADNYTNGFSIDYLELISFIAIITSILVIINKNPVVSVLFLIGLFLSISLYLIMIGLTFIGIAYLLVYIGAVSMLFLFILMLIDIRISELHVENTNSLFLAFLMGIIFYFTLSDSLYTNNVFFDTSNSLYNELYYTSSSMWDTYLLENDGIVGIGNVLYTNYSIWLIIASLILLLAMVGAIIININPTKS